MGFLLGLCAFALLFLSDYNDWRLRQKGLKLCFPVGGILLVVGTCLRFGTVSCAASLWLRSLSLLAVLVFLALLIHTLFFAIPVGASYARPGEKRDVCTVGVYALCRHPGVLWFAGLYLCLWPAAGLPPADALVYCGLNVLLVWVEDRFVFPELLKGYAEYQATTPFLIPNGASIRACLKRN